MASDLFLEEFAAVTDGAADVQAEYTVREAFATAHVLHGIHQSPHRTWDRLHHLFPQVELPFTVVRDLVEECAFCAKVRRGLDIRLPRQVLSTLPAEGLRVLGSDWAPISPPGEGGSTGTGYYVMVLLHSKLCMVVPRPSILLFVCTYGTVDELCSDQGSEYTSEVIKETYGQGLDTAPKVP